MPRILVVTEEGAPRRRRIVMNEQVLPEHLDDDHSAYQVLERLNWSLHDAARAEARFRAALGS